MEPNELPEMLQSIRHLKTYNVPDGYFEGLADDILSQVNLPLSAATPLMQPPVNYFDNLADSILSKIKREAPQSEVQKELEEIEPLLASLPRTNVYAVPQGYFDSFTVAPPAKKQEVPVIKLRRPAKWITYAAAAVVTGILATGIVFFTGTKQDSPDEYTAALSKVTDNELSAYLDNTTYDSDMLPAATSDDNHVGNSEGLYKILLNNVSDNEIQNYLNENDDSNETNSKGI